MSTDKHAAKAQWDLAYKNCFQTLESLEHVSYISKYWWRCAKLMLEGADGFVQSMFKGKG